MINTLEHKYVLPNDTEKIYSHSKMLVNGIFFSLNSNEQPVLGGQVLLAANEEEHNFGEDYVFVDENGTAHFMGALITEIYEEPDADQENFAQDVIDLLENSLHIAGASLNTKWNGQVSLHPDIKIETFNPEESEPFNLAGSNTNY